MAFLSTLKNMKFDMLDANDKLKLTLIVGTSTIAGCFAYITLKIYLNHRKYSHIPGPPNKG